jgi:lactate racemase
LNLSVWYNGQDVELVLPESARVTLYDLPGRKLSVIGDSHWLNTGVVPNDLKAFLRDSSRLLIVINDLFRPTPTARILGALRPALKVESTRVLVATGLHPARTSSDLSLLLGELSGELGPRLQVHDASDDAGLSDYGVVRLNKLFDWCDAILIIGSVEPHYFAGFTGGRKIILPGCASFEDVRRNHAMAVEVDSQPLRRKGNPVWEDIQSRTVCLDDKTRCAIQVVCDHDRNVFFASSGDWDVSYNQACEFVIANYAHLVEEPFDVIISIVYPPLDRNLYQLQKSYENVAVAVKDGGTILLISSCRDGVGDDRFLKIAAALATGEAISGGDGEDSVMGIHKVRRTQRIAGRIDLMLCSTLAGSVLKDLPIVPRSDVSSAVSELFDKYGRNCRIAVVLDAASQVLYRHVA